MKKMQRASRGPLGHGGHIRNVTRFANISHSQVIGSFPVRLILCVILRHEKRKIQEIMDCENIGGFSHTTRIRRWPPYLTCVVIFEN